MERATMTPPRRRLLPWVAAWATMLAVFLAGLKAAWLTGQADPWCWGAPMLVAMAALGAVLRGPAFWVGPGAAGMALLFCGVASARWPDPVAAGGLVALALLAAVAGYGLRARRWAGGGLALALSLLLLWGGPARLAVPMIDRPPLAVVTGLPLFWAEGGAGLAGPVDAPIVTLLRTRFTVRPVDDLQALAASGVRRLLLAQPRALWPAQMAAVDQWVRDGGRAVVLADPLLRWPSGLPLGDRRRPPSASLLWPLLDHWGFQAGDRREEEMRWFAPDGALLTLSGVQHFATAGGGQPLARKRIGRGEVVVLGDADLLDDRLWLADPARPLDPRAWSADTPARIVQWLGGDLPGERRWMRHPADVRSALRWALLFGTGWAILGAALFWAGRPAGRWNRA